MHTACFLPVFPSMHCSRGVVPACRGCTCPGGTWSGGVPGLEGTCSQGVYLLPGGCTCSQGGMYLPGRYLPRYSPPVNRMTDRCKNITLPQTSFAGGKNLAFAGCEWDLPFHFLEIQQSESCSQERIGWYYGQRYSDSEQYRGNNRTHNGTRRSEERTYTCQE